MIRFSARSAYLLLVPQRRALIGDRALVWDRALRNRLFPCFKVFEIVKMGARTLIAELSFRHSFYLVRVVLVEDIRVAWLVYVRTYYVPIATLNQNKRSRLRYLGDAQITSRTKQFFFLSGAHNEEWATLIIGLFVTAFSPSSLFLDSF